MAIHQTKKNSDLEKRLKLLRTQVYGRQTLRADDLKISTSSNPFVQSDIVFLRQDLLKISILSGIAILTQGILFYLARNNILNLNFF